MKYRAEQKLGKIIILDRLKIDLRRGRRREDRRLDIRAQAPLGSSRTCRNLLKAA